MTKTSQVWSWISAGAIICGANILTTNDINCCGSTHFTGFGLVEYNFVAHYPDADGLEREKMDARIASYHQFHDNPIVSLEEKAHILISEDKH